MKSATEHYRQYKKLVISTNEEIQKLKQKLHEKDQANDRLLRELDRYRTKNNKQSIHIVHLEHLLAFFFREEQGVYNSVDKAPKMVK